jgi:hypothetical protein
MHSLFFFVFFFGWLRCRPSVRQVADWYKQSFQEVREAPAPTSVEKEAHFAMVIERVYRRHAPTLVTMARGAYEARQLLAGGDISTFAENQDVSRCLLVSCYVVLHKTCHAHFLPVQFPSFLLLADPPLPGQVLHEPHRDSYDPWPVPGAARTAG